MWDVDLLAGNVKVEWNGVEWSGVEVGWKCAANKRLNDVWRWGVRGACAVCVCVRVH